VDRRVGGQPADLRPVLGGEQLPAGVERLAPADDRHQPGDAVLPQPGGREAQQGHVPQQRRRGDGVLGQPLPPPGIDDVEGHQLHRAGPAAQDPGRPRLLAGAYGRDVQQIAEDGVLGPAAVGDGPAVLERPALRTELVTLVGERPFRLGVPGALP
jgi:hypothetical protein